MAVKEGTFETLIHSQFISLTFPNPVQTKTTLNPYGDLLRIAVLDSHVKFPDPPLIAAMLVPKDRENDWIFSTETGQIQLLSNLPGISRLILVGNLPLIGDCSGTIYNRPIRTDTMYRLKFEESLTPFLLALSPKVCFENSLPVIPFVSYEDNVVRCVSVERCIGSCVGEMLVEDVEIDCYDELSESPIREFRRRLRFKRMPNLIQTQIQIAPMRSDSVNFEFGEVEFRLETGILVHPYLPPMVASLCLIAPYLEESVRSGLKPRTLCVGVGGGALLTFLRTHFEFEVIGVEADQTVLRVARQHFGLMDGEFLRVFVGDGLEMIKNFSMRATHQNLASYGAEDAETDRYSEMFDSCNSRFDVIMVDLDSSNARNGVTAPPLEFIQKPVLLAVKLVLHKRGILVINVIPQSRFFYDCLILEFRKVFPDLYEIDVGNGENYVLIATASPIEIVSNGRGDSILKKLKLVISEAFLDCIKKI